MGHQMVLGRLRGHGAHPGGDCLAVGSVALLADAIHNVGDAATALPLWMAFALTQRPPLQRVAYGLGWRKKTLLASALSV